MSPDDAVVVVNKLLQYENVFIDAVVTEELGFQFHGEDSGSILSEAFVMFLGSFLFGCMPVIVFWIELWVLTEQTVLLFLVTPATGLVLLCVLGAHKGRLTKLSPCRAAWECVSIGFSGCLISFLVATTILRLLCNVGLGDDDTCYDL
jgi:VIT1/CCC1 family predicted Fe2+/Mn2+ transporter